MLKACLNGGHGREAHPAVPLTAAELAADAARCATSGEDGSVTPRSSSPPPDNRLGGR